MAEPFDINAVTISDSDYEDVEYQQNCMERYLTTFSQVDMPSFDIGVNQGIDDLQYEESRKGVNYMSNDSLESLGKEQYFNTYIRFNMHDKAIFYLLRAELLVNRRHYREALGAAIVAETLLGRNNVLSAIKMICMYQLNDDKRFGELKEEVISSGFVGLSDTLKQQVIGTIQVSKWIPEFLNCLDNMKAKRTL